MCQHKTPRYQMPEEMSIELLQWAQEETSDSSFVAISTCSSDARASQCELINLPEKNEAIWLHSNHSSCLGTIAHMADHGETISNKEGQQSHIPCYCPTAWVATWEGQAATQTADISLLCPLSCCTGRAFLAQTQICQPGALVPWWSVPGGQSRRFPAQQEELLPEGQQDHAALVTKSRPDSANRNRGSPSASSPPTPADPCLWALTSIHLWFPGHWGRSFLLCRATVWQKYLQPS